MGCKEQEHKFGEHGKKKCEGEKGRKRPAEENNKDEVQEFFALLGRIHAMHKLYKERRMNFPSAGQKPTSVWKLSFQWEDFSSLPWKDSSFGDYSNNTSTSVVCEKPCIGRDQRLGERSFDLNVEATAEG
ncbi:hypothetical protein SUGI_0029730 [Cryptomeria japonica]|nr:hypothetical protein SUGI_0029730 [Cryptomeria japonica]